MSSPDWQKIAKELGTSDKERLAIWMIQHGFATGHGDTLDDLLHEMSRQIAEDQFGPPGEAYMEIIQEQRMLIAKLVAAIVDLQHPYAEHAYDELLQRAREVTK